MRFAFVLLFAVLACEPKPASSVAPTTSASAVAPATSAKLTDLSASLEPVRAAFNARDRQARFLTLLSPA